MGVFRDLIFRLKYGNDSDIEELMKNREEIRAEIKSLLKEKREIELRIEKVLAAREETRIRVEKQMEMEKKGKKQGVGKAEEKTGILGKAGIFRKIGKKQDQGKGKEIPGKEGEKSPEIRKKAARKKEGVSPHGGTGTAGKEIDSEVMEAAELMSETIAEAELEAGTGAGKKVKAGMRTAIKAEKEEGTKAETEAGVKTGSGKDVKTEMGTEEGTEVETGAGTGVGKEESDKKTPSEKKDKFSALFSSQMTSENEDDSGKMTKDGKGKDEKPSAGFFGGDLLEELLNDDTLNAEEEKNILKFIEDTSTEELIRDLRDVREQLIAESS